MNKLNLSVQSHNKSIKLKTDPIAINPIFPIQKTTKANQSINQYFNSMYCM